MDATPHACRYHTAKDRFALVVMVAEGKPTEAAHAHVNSRVADERRGGLAG